MKHEALKTVLITGATGGLGLACAQALLGAGGHHILLGARDEQKAQRVHAALSTLGSCEVVPLDLASLGQVRRATSALARVPQLDAIVCNAGVHLSGAPTFTVDGLETTFAVNHLAHQLLVLRLLGSLADDARIVVVSSGTHDPDTLEGRGNPPAAVDVQALAQGREGTGPLASVRRYSTSKLCNLLFMRELDRRLRASGSRVTVNGYDPGAVPGTDLTRGWSPVMRLLVQASWLLRIAGVAVSTPQRAGRAMARLVTDAELTGTSGRYFQLERERQPSTAARDPALARTCFEDSLALLGESSPV